jgi:serine/threonine protein kinase
MGEVYRATDTKLKREVAVKILPSAMAADSDRLARFQREAEGLCRNPGTLLPRWTHFEFSINIQLTIVPHDSMNDFVGFVTS